MEKEVKEVFDRRRAIECKLVRHSNSHPGYYRYDILVGEKDGSTHWEPAYGVDMTDALNRLMWTERVENFEEKVSSIPSWVLSLGWILFTIVPGAIVSYYMDTAIPIMISIGVNGVMAAFYSMMKNHLTK